VKVRRIKTEETIMDAEHVDTKLPKDKLMADLRLVVSDAEELLRSTASQTGEKAAAARAKLQESLQTAKERLSAAEAVVIERTKQAAEATDQYVHDNPWKAMGAALSLGIIIGVLIGRR
jgi:ElaB/YqjD/DUF883 family membrane-anchored ribosome-binding protein